MNLMEWKKMRGQGVESPQLNSGTLKKKQAGNSAMNVDTFAVEQGGFQIDLGKTTPPSPLWSFKLVLELAKSLAYIIYCTI